MCTAFTWLNGDLYLGRNMDIEYRFGEQVILVPRNKELSFKCEESQKQHYAIMGMGAVVDDYPLFAEGFNEKGLCVAGLNFFGYAHCTEEKISDLKNITPYEVIPWVLAQCATVREAKELLCNVNIVGIPFKENLPLPTLHWFLSAKDGTIVLESTLEGIKIFDNPVGVLTNNPTFDYHLYNLQNYLKCSPQSAMNEMISDMDLIALGEGAGALGLPGDVSSPSRFIKAVFGKCNSVSDVNETNCVAQVFHVLDSVAMIKGSVITKGGKYDITTYSCCANLDQQLYYYKTYDNNQFTCIDMKKENLDESELKTFPLVEDQQINYLN